MCSPALVMAGFSAGQALLGVAQSYEDSAHESAYQQSLKAASEKQVALNREVALKSYGAQANAENTRLAQEEATATEQVLQANIRAARAIGEAKVAGATAGVDGVSLGALYDDYGRENARYTDAIRLSREQDRSATEVRKEGFQREAENRILSLAPYIPRPVTTPSAIGSVLRIASAGGEGYAKATIWNQRKS